MSDWVVSIDLGATKTALGLVDPTDTIIAALEGAIILSRTERSIAPLEHVAVELAGLVEAATGSGATSRS